MLLGFSGTSRTSLTLVFPLLETHTDFGHYGSDKRDLHGWTHYRFSRVTEGRGGSLKTSLIYMTPFLDTDVTMYARPFKIKFI